MPTSSVTCPSCFESFEILLPPLDEAPCEVDYDCEICCRPMIVVFEPDGNSGLAAWAKGLQD